MVSILERIGKGVTQQGVALCWLLFRQVSNLFAQFSGGVLDLQLLAF